MESRMCESGRKPPIRFLAELAAAVLVFLGGYFTWRATQEIPPPPATVVEHEAAPSSQ